MKKEWTDLEIKRAEKEIVKWLNSRPFMYLRRAPGKVYFDRLPRLTIKSADSLLGFAYTSSGRAAYLGICNTNISLDAQHKFRICGFEMGERGELYAVCISGYPNEIEILIPVNNY